MSRISDEFRSVKNPHDAGFKTAFRKREVAKAFFRNYFPKDIVERIDFRYLKIENGSYVDETFRDLHSDIVYRAKIRGKAAFLYILFEHQSKPDEWMVFRLLSYMVNFWRTYIDQHPEAKALPVVLPAILYHGKQPWKAPRSLLEIIEDGEAFKKYIPDFSYDLYNLSDYEDERLLLGGAMTLGVVLYLMKHVFDENFNDKLVRAAEYLIKIRDEKTQLEFLEWMLGYSYHARDDAREGVEKALDVVNTEKARRMAMTYAEQLRQEGQQAGRGIGRSELISRLLKKKFGKISLRIKEKLNASAIDMLDRFGEAIFDFENLRDAERWWENQKNGENT